MEENELCKDKRHVKRLGCQTAHIKWRNFRKKTSCEELRYRCSFKTKRSVDSCLLLLSCHMVG
jgi:hypothetical protein